MLGYVWRDLVRNPRRTFASLVGVALGVGLFAGVLFFVDASGATMTRRAITPLALDMQRVLTSPMGRRLSLEQRISGPSPLGPGQEAEVSLTVVNSAAAPANEVVVNDEPPPPLSYVHGTTTLAGEALPDRAGQSPLAQGLARSGLNVGTIPAGATVRLTYRARANQAVPDVAALPVHGRISSREDVVPLAANARPPLTLADLQARTSRLPGVAAADGLYFVDLPAGVLAAGRTVEGPARLFAFDQRYLEHYPSIRVVDGSFAPGTALLSAEAARALGAGPGATITLALPGTTRPLVLRIGGVADLSRATPLFSSRKSSKLEDFLYVPNSVVVDPATFEREVIPAFRRATAMTGSRIKSLPVLELDVLVDRSRLQSDPGRALSQTEAIAESVVAVAPDQDYLIDNISNTLAVARDDAAVGKRMFVFLGLPGLLLAAFLAGYAGSVLATTQRREQAILRIRGAGRRHLLRMLGYRTLAFAGAGALLGVALGFVAVMAIMGPADLLAAPASELLTSALIATGVGLAITAVALYLPGHRSLGREIGEQRRELPAGTRPAWWRWRLDLALVAVAVVAGGVALGAGAFDAPPPSVFTGQAATLPSHLLLAPLVAWFGGTLVAVRVFEAMLARLPVPAAPTFGPLVGGTLRRSVRRRPWALASGIVGIGLVTAFGVNLAMFAGTYDAAKAADARFVVGSDLRVTPSVLSDRPHAPSFAATLMVPGVTDVAPVVANLENAVLIGPYDQDRADLAAIDPASFGRAAALGDSGFSGSSAFSGGSAAMAALAADPEGVLVSARAADALSIETGDEVRVLLARGTEQQTLVPFTVLGTFEHFPGFPRGLDVVANLSTYTDATGLDQVDFFLARTEHRGPVDLARAASAIRAAVGEQDPVNVDTTATALNKDQSSLTALDIQGLVTLDSIFTMLMSAACVAIFVFGLMLQRRREYVMLRALGMPARDVRGLVLGEAGLVSVCGVIAGVVVAAGMIHLFVHILRPLFVLDPGVVLWSSRGLFLVALPLVAAALSALGATALLRRIRPAELLRET